MEALDLRRDRLIFGANRMAKDDDMRTFLVACVAAAVIAICAVVVLNKFQKPVDTAFATSAVRI
jgi:hypothetical protein